MSSENLLMVADSDRDANMLYAVGMVVPDPFIYLRVDGRPRIILPEEAVDHARDQAAHCRVSSLHTYQQRLRRQGVADPTLSDVVALLLNEQEVKKVQVPREFSLGLAKELKKHGIKVRPKQTAMFPQRALKSPDEIKKISAALMMAEVGLAEGIHAIKTARPNRQAHLILGNSPLTPGRVRSIINTAVVQSGGKPSRTSVFLAGQPRRLADAIPLPAHKPIVIGVAPRSQTTGYFGEISRTVVKGRAAESVRAMYDAVAAAQDLAFSLLTENSKASELHQALREFFARQGFKTGKSEGRMNGFFKEVGHGLGLENDEAPNLSATSGDLLSTGHVVTVRPSLSYPGLGGVELTDVAHLTKNGAKNLTHFEKVLEV